MGAATGAGAAGVRAGVAKHIHAGACVLTPRWHSEFAQGRLSASLAALRLGRDNRFWELERGVVGVAVNREKLREWGASRCRSDRYGRDCDVPLLNILLI